MSRLWCLLWLSGVTLGVAMAGPQVDAASAILMDQDTGAVIWEKDADTPREPASTTKVMTAMLLLEHTTPDEVLTAPEGVEEVIGASLHLKPGERLTSDALLRALMLRSANDACFTVALHISGSLEGFSQLMNQRARELGATRTNFVNPHGLSDPRHVTTARDLALIARAAMRYPRLAEVAAMQRSWIERSLNQEDLLLISKNRLLARDPRAGGIKTGWTTPARQCFVGQAEYGGMRIITVVLRSEQWLVDSQSLFDYAFDHYERRRVVEAGQRVGSAPIAGGEAREVAAMVKEEHWAVVRKEGEAPEVGFEPLPDLQAPMNLGQVVGHAVMPDGRRVLAVAAEVVPRRWTLGQRLFSLESLSFALAVAAGAYLFRRRSRTF